MPNFNIDSYRYNFTGGAKSFLFYHKPLWPTSMSLGTEEATYLVRATSLPETTIEEITTNWQGFDYRFAGKYTYTDWTVTYNCDMDAYIQKNFHDWFQMIHDPTSNVYNSPASYMVDQEIEMLNDAGEPTQRYKLFGAWPKSIGSAQLDYSANDVVQFDVTYSYIYHAVNRTAYSSPPTFANNI